MRGADGRVRIGGAAAMWGDSAIATPQLLAVPDLDYLMYDYLAETTMAILARARRRPSGVGYVAEFVDVVLRRHLAECLAQGVRVVTDAGGLDPEGCRAAVEALAAELGLKVAVAAVGGDDVLDRLGELAGEGVGGAPGPALSANAYLGARGIAEALSAGAQVVVTGRVVDSALALGPLVHEHGWSWTDLDRLSAGSLAGHVIECGAQATGGLFTDWQEVAGWDDIGYPVVEVVADGTFVVTKPADTGGLVSPATVAEQVVYEIGDPSAYVLADVVCDWRAVEVAPDPSGPHRVRVVGARGRPPTGQLKVCVTQSDGWLLDALLAIRGIDAVAKAERTAEALLARTRRQLADAGYADYAETRVELLGTGAAFSPAPASGPVREVVLRVAVAHAQREGLTFLRTEAASAGVSMGPGTRGHFGGRPSPRERVAVGSVLVDAARIGYPVEGAAALTPAEPPPSVFRGGLSRQEGHSSSRRAGEPEPTLPTVPLVELAWARSGDKGDTSNIGVIARHPELVATLRSELTPERVWRWMAQLLGPDAEVTRYELPGLGAFNFVLTQALGGGGAWSLRSDPLGKAYAQVLLELPIPIPAGQPHLPQG